MTERVEVPGSSPGGMFLEKVDQIAMGGGRGDMGWGVGICDQIEYKNHKHLNICDQIDCKIPQMLKILGS